MTVEDFVKRELVEVKRMHVYAPIIVDALFNLDQRSYNSLSGNRIL